MTGPPNDLSPTAAIHLMFLCLPSSMLQSVGTFLSTTLAKLRCEVPPKRGQSLLAASLPSLNATTSCSWPGGSQQQSQGAGLATFVLGAELQKRQPFPERA